MLGMAASYDLMAGYTTAGYSIDNTKFTLAALHWSSVSPISLHTGHYTGIC